MNMPTAGVPIIGQPLTITTVALVLKVQASCNCGGAQTTLEIFEAPGVCPSCLRSFTAALNPQNGQIAIGMTSPEKEPS